MGRRGPYVAKRARYIQAKAEQLRDAVAASRSIAQVLRALGLRVAGENYVTVRRAVKVLGLSTTHWTGQGHRKGSRVPIVPARPLCEVLVRGSLHCTSRLRRRLIREGLLEARCAICRLDSWREEPMPLELDHIDGDRFNNCLENLRLLCPNCHAQAPTYRGRNIGKRPL